MKRSSITVAALAAGLAIAAPVMAFDPAPALPECPPQDGPVLQTVTCPEVPAPPQDEVGRPPLDEAPPLPRALLRRTFTAEGDVVDVIGSRRRGMIVLADAELNRTPRRLAEYLDAGDLAVKVTARTRLVTEGGERLRLGDMEPDDAVEVRGTLAPLVRWMEDEDGNVTPVLIAKRVVVIDLDAPDEQP